MPSPSPAADPEPVPAPGHDATLEAQVAEAAAFLRQCANDRRLLVLCRLLSEGESSVGRLAQLVGLSQPALSQHLTRLRAEGLVATRRHGTTIHYRIADPRVAALIGSLRGIFCPAAEPPQQSAAPAHRTTPRHGAR
ncbi:MAG: helix-turn-helix transcriptional regulator [Alphaproteobacteria bacterium]|nr:helix-turn-helix transcriptional regulator [Alphaproteobacteria bacterium]